MENIIISIIGITVSALATFLAWCAYRNHRKREGPWHRFGERYSFIGMWYFAEWHCTAFPFLFHDSLRTSICLSFCLGIFING